MTTDEIEAPPSPDERILTSAGAAGRFMKSYLDGSLSGVPDDEAYKMVLDASSSPETVAALMGVPDEVADAVSPDTLTRRMVGLYYDERAAKTLEDADVSELEERENYDRRRVESIMECSDVDPDVARRILFDAERGDESPFVAVREKFYFG